MLFALLLVFLEVGFRVGRLAVVGRRRLRPGGLAQDPVAKVNRCLRFPLLGSGDEPVDDLGQGIDDFLLGRIEGFPVSERLRSGARASVSSPGLPAVWSRSREDTVTAPPAACPVSRATSRARSAGVRLATKLARGSALGSFPVSVQREVQRAEGVAVT